MLCDGFYLCYRNLLILKYNSLSLTRWWGEEVKLHVVDGEEFAEIFRRDYSTEGGEVGKVAVEVWRGEY